MEDNLNKTAQHKLKMMLMEHEGYRAYPYQDTVGKLTIGCGHNLTDNGISPAVGALMLSEDMEFFIENLPKKLNFWNRLNDARKIVLLNMAFNMGINGLLTFRKMLTAVDHNDFEGAAKEMLNSKWARQVKGRADELARVMMTGELDAIH